MTGWSAGRLYSALTSEPGVPAETGLAYGAHPRQRLDIYRAGRGIEQAPVVVFYYGGGWTGGDRATYGFVGAALAARGITTVIADYRLYPEVKFPEFVQDAARAYAWVAREAGPGGKLAAKGGGSRPIILAGHSAGAHTAALLALDPSYLERFAPGAARPAGLIGMAGPYAFDPTAWPSTKAIFAPASGNPDGSRPVSFAAAARGLRVLLMHGLADGTVKLFNMRDMAAALATASAPVTSKTYPGVGHVGLVLTLSTPFRWRASTLDDIVAFVEGR
jgi:acetyl esterase/lipase